MSVPFPPVPPNLKQLNHFLKVALEHETRDPVVAYWARFYAVQLGLTIDKSSPEAKLLLFSLLEWLEKRKKELNDDAINIESVAEAHIENYAVKIFSWADGQERNTVHNKNVVKAFYTAGILFDILSNFTKELSEDFERMKKYAKWRAAYIHNCLKNGEVPEVPADTSYDYDEGAQDIFGPEPGQGPGTSSGQNQDYNSGGWNLPPAPPQDPYASSFQPQPPPGSSARPGSGNGGYSPMQPMQPTFPTQPQQPQFQPVPLDVPAEASSNLSIEQIAKAQKYCKWAGSALNFDDVPTAVLNLRKALTLLQTGQELVQ